MRTTHIQKMHEFMLREDPYGEPHIQHSANNSILTWNAPGKAVTIQFHKDTKDKYTYTIIDHENVSTGSGLIEKPMVAVLKAAIDGIKASSGMVEVDLTDYLP